MIGLGFGTFQKTCQNEVDFKFRPSGWGGRVMDLANWSGKVSNALDQAIAEHIVLTQSKLAQANSKDIGRMASSWFVGKGQPDLLT